MILFGLLGLILLLVCQICHMNCQTDKVKIKENLFLKSVRWFDQRYYCVPFDIPFAMHLVNESYYFEPMIDDCVGSNYSRKA